MQTSGHDEQVGCVFGDSRTEAVDRRVVFLFASGGATNTGLQAVAGYVVFLSTLLAVYLFLDAMSVATVLPRVGSGQCPGRRRARVSISTHPGCTGCSANVNDES